MNTRSAFVLGFTAGLLALTGGVVAFVRRNRAEARSIIGRAALAAGIRYAEGTEYAPIVRAVLPRLTAEARDSFAAEVIGESIIEGSEL